MKISLKKKTVERKMKAVTRICVAAFLCFASIH